MKKYKGIEKLLKKANVPYSVLKKIDNEKEINTYIGLLLNEQELPENVSFVKEKGELITEETIIQKLRDEIRNGKKLPYNAMQDTEANFYVAKPIFFKTEESDDETIDNALKIKKLLSYKSLAISFRILSIAAILGVIAYTAIQLIYFFA